jgi:hypothetical protein
VWDDPYAEWKAFRRSIGMHEMPVNGNRYPSPEAAATAHRFMQLACHRIYLMRQRGVPESPNWKLPHLPQCGIEDDPMAEFAAFRRSLGMPEAPSRRDRYPDRKSAKAAVVIYRRCLKRAHKKASLMKNAAADWLPSPEELA